MNESKRAFVTGQCDEWTFALREKKLLPMKVLEARASASLVVNVISE